MAYQYTFVITNAGEYIIDNNGAYVITAIEDVGTDEINVVTYDTDVIVYTL